eukprot:c45887_g1_i1.p1 GENE.c45887_g1_i1~~c45887_g1_i1.p1  ORF type:complete len:408 (+),score=63.99 c45887_g1_i1:52-1275(+)
MYFTGNVQYEAQGLLSPRTSREKAPKLHGIEFLRFLAAVHILLGEIFPGKHDDSFVQATTKNIKSWGFTGFTFFCMLSGFVLSYNYAPNLDGSRFGYNVFHFFLKRMSWLFPLFFVSLLLPIWADPVDYLSTFRRVLKFVATLLGVTGWWPPSFRTYKLNDNAWMASSFLFFYLFMMPLLLKPIHQVLSRVARKWLFLFAWPWTWFFGFIAERVDEASSDYGEHWDWAMPILYAPSFFMGLVLGSIFVERPLEHDSKIFSVAERFLGLIAFAGGIVVYMFAPVGPMYNWHQTGSLLFLQAIVVYFFANGKDILGMIFSLFPFRFLGGFAFPILVLMFPVQAFAKQIQTVDFKISYSVSMLCFVMIGRWLVEIPYARWLLHIMEERFTKVAPAEDVEKLTSTPKDEDE